MSKASDVTKNGDGVPINWNSLDIAKASDRKGDFVSSYSFLSE
jgi:hypothetical protein